MLSPATTFPAALPGSRENNGEGRACSRRGGRPSPAFSWPSPMCRAADRISAAVIRGRKLIVSEKSRERAGTGEEPVRPAPEISPIRADLTTGHTQPATGADTPLHGQGNALHTAL